MQTTYLPNITFERKIPGGVAKHLECPPESKLIALEANAMGISWSVVPFSTEIQCTYNGRSEYIRDGVASTNHVPGPQICVNKYLTRVHLEHAGIHVANGYGIMQQDTEADRKKVFETLRKPIVVKPAFGTHGSGVKVGIETFQTMNEHVDFLFNTAEKDSDTHVGMVLAEEMAIGKEYRIIATKEKVLAVMYRQPASVLGDGVQTIEALIAEKNKMPARNISQQLYPHIHIDNDMLEVLSSQGFSLSDVVDKDLRVWLRRVSNIMAGGDAFDVTDEIHPSVEKIATGVTRAIPGMTLVGIDFMTTDISTDQHTDNYTIIEVNSAPEYAMHDLPMYGKKRGVARAILTMLFPEWRENSQSAS